jgi:hypothetical protein
MDVINKSAIKLFETRVKLMEICETYVKLIELF